LGAQFLSAGRFTVADALGTLLTVEGLLFAAFALSVTLAGPSERPRAWLIPAPVLAGIAVAALVVVAAGAGSAWERIFVRNGFPVDFSRRIIAIAILTALIVQPLLAFLLAMGLREDR
jgi:hypothetical protein